MSIPDLYVACGLEANLYEMNTRFRGANSIPLSYEEGPGGHTWEFCGQYIARPLEWLKLNGLLESSVH